MSEKSDVWCLFPPLGKSKQTGLIMNTFNVSFLLLTNDLEEILFYVSLVLHQVLISFFGHYKQAWHLYGFLQVPLFSP